MGALDKGCANIIYRLVPEPARIPVYPERPHSDCSGQVVIEYDQGILACGGGITKACHHYRYKKFKSFILTFVYLAVYKRWGSFDMAA